MMAGAKEKSRFEKRFELWDRDGDGVIERSDFETDARILARKFGEQGTEKEQMLTDAYMNVWDSLSTAAGKSRIGKDDFLRLADEAIISQGDSGFAHVLQPLAEAVVKLLDTDDDGRISEQEFRTWAGVIGVHGTGPSEAFERLDTNGSGSLSRDEFTEAVRDYLLGRHDAPLLGVD